MNPWASDQAGADDRGSEKVLVWQSIIGGRCITAIGGRFDAGESGNRVLQRGWDLGAGVVARHRRPGAAMTLLRVSDVSSLTFADPPVCVPSLLAPSGDWYGSPLAGKVSLSSRSPISPRAPTDPIHEILDTPPRKRCLTLRGRIVHSLVMRDRLPWGAKCSIVSKTGAPMRNALPLRGPQDSAHRMPLVGCLLRKYGSRRPLSSD